MESSTSPGQDGGSSQLNCFRLGRREVGSFRLRRSELNGSRLGWRLERCWDFSTLGRRKHGIGSSRLRSMTQLEMVRRGFRIQSTQLTVLGVSKLGRRKLSGSRLGRRELDSWVVSLGRQNLVTGWAT